MSDKPQMPWNTLKYVAIQYVFVIALVAGLMFLVGESERYIMASTVIAAFAFMFPVIAFQDALYAYYD